MYKRITLSFALVILVCGLNAQSLNDIIHKRQLVSEKDKHNRSETRSITLDLVITTPSGDVPAKLQILENIGYRLELLSKTNKSAQIINLKGIYNVGENGKLTEEIAIDSREYQAKKSFLIIDELEYMTRDEFPKDRIEMMGNVDLSSGFPCHAFRIRSENPEIFQEFYFDIEKFNLIKKTINYSAADGSPVVEQYTFNNYKLDKETLLYPFEFSTKFGLAIVKSIKLNTDMTPRAFEF